MQLQLNQLKNNEIYSSLKGALPGPLTLEWVDLHLLKDTLKKKEISDEALQSLLYGTETQPAFSGFTEKRVSKLLNQLTNVPILQCESKGHFKKWSGDALPLEPKLLEGLQKNLSEQKLRNLRKEARTKLKEAFHRLCEPLQKSALNQNEVRLNLGAGNESYPNYLKIDWAGPQHIFDDIVTLKKIKDDSVSEIYSNHVLEHIPPALILPMLKRWYAVLKKGGVLRLRMPDAKQTVLNLGHPWNETSPESAKSLGFPPYLQKESSLNGIVDDELAIQFIYGWSDSMPNHWDMSNQHKSLWTPELGKKRLEEAGFKIECAKNFGTLQTILIARK